MFDFNEFLERIGLNPRRTRLLRHNPHGVAAWRRGREQAFGCFASFQKMEPTPYGAVGEVDHACHFLPGPPLAEGGNTALFLGTTRILNRWDWNGERLPVIRDDEIIAGEQVYDGVEAFDLEWIEPGSEFCERILIEWGPAPRGWSQWAYRQPKRILEMRLQAQEPPFPGFSAFLSRISELPAYPLTWTNALSSVRGTYLLVADTGEQYVGSAAGEEGFIGRWREYLRNGHGGNRRLREREHRDYRVSILEVASPGMSVAEIVGRESFWKEKLGARAFGLNAN